MSSRAIARLFYLNKIFARNLIDSSLCISWSLIVSFGRQRRISSFLLWLMEEWVICCSIFRGSLFTVDQSLMFTNSLFTTLKVWTSWKVSKYRVFSGPYFSVLGLNTEIYGANLYSQSEYRKMRTRKTLYLDTFHARCLISLWLKKRLI